MNAAIICGISLFSGCKWPALKSEQVPDAISDISIFPTGRVDCAGPLLNCLTPFLRIYNGSKFSHNNKLAGSCCAVAVLAATAPSSLLLHLDE